MTSRPIAEVRLADEADRALVPEIDRRAEVVFEIAGYVLPQFGPPTAAAAELALFVVGTPAVGFLKVDEVDGLAHIAEVAVLPDSMRQGLGARLLEHACDWASAHGYPAVTLTTYAEVAWNAPFYARHGFGEIADLTPMLAAIRAREAEVGLDAVGPRIVMRRALT